MRARLHHLVIDCPDPRALAEFYARLLDRPVTYDSEDFVVVAESDRTSGLAFQRATGFRPPTWPSPETPQQMHLDVMVEDPAAARTHVLRLGATHLDGDVYADPAGHPFCLIRRPHWADELS
jgi:catechol 2,3-dioxygenase-like lactoylglutathione lyase family enzyme